MEIIVAISILSILAATLAMRAGGMIDKGKTTKIVGLANTFKTVCASYHSDVGSYPREYANSTAANRRLSAKQATTGWSGPYIESPLTPGQNPFGGTVHLYDVVTAGNKIPGFDTDGDGTLDVKAGASMLYFSKVPAAAAEAIDDTIDRDLKGTWSNAHRERDTSSDVVVSIRSRSRLGASHATIHNTASRSVGPARVARAAHAHLDEAKLEIPGMSKGVRRCRQVTWTTSICLGRAAQV
jgi:type II secretory pathway pseudopilin PulG